MGSFITKDGKKIPATIFAGQKNGPDSAANYASISLVHEESYDDNDWDMAGFKAMRVYAYLRLFGELQKRGIKRLDLGGSETLDLDEGKRRVGGKPEKSYWVVKPGVEKVE